MTSGPLHLATVGRQAPATSFVILPFILPLIVDRHLYSMICMSMTVSDLNSSLAFCFTLIFPGDFYPSYSRSFRLYFSLCFTFIFHRTPPARIKMDRQELLFQFHMLNHLEGFTA